MTISVLPIPYHEALPWLLTKHYAKRAAPVSFAFGAYENGVLLGVVTYGLPASRPLCVGLMGETWADRVLELNRLCCDSRKNLASMLVGQSLRQLPAPTAVVSYADTGVGHIGYVYQATNFLYTGLSARHVDYVVEGREKDHGRHLGRTGGYDKLVEVYGADKVKVIQRPRKHRYVYLVGDKRQRRAMQSSLRYTIEPYPKGESQRYDAGGELPTQLVMF